MEESMYRLMEGCGSCEEAHVATPKSLGDKVIHHEG